MQSRLSFTSFGALAAAITLATAAAGQSVDDFCTGDPCVIAGDVVVGDNADLDFGERNVILRAVLDAGDGIVTLRAGSFEVDAPGQIVGSGVVSIEVDGDVRLDGTRTRGAVRMVGEEGGDFAVTSYRGSVSGAGRLVLNASDLDGDGGTLSIDAAAAVALSGAIESIGGFDGGGGTVEVVAGGDVALLGGVDLSGGGFDGGAIDIESQGSITLGDVVVDSGGDLGAGGDVLLAATGDVGLQGIVLGRGSGLGADQCGDGGAVEVSAGGTIRVTRVIDVSARAGDCWGGEVDLTAGAVEVGATLALRGVSGEGRGGVISITSARPFTCTTQIAFNGNARGGLAELDSGGDLRLGSGCLLDGAGPGGAVELVSAGELAVTGALRVGSTSAGIARDPAGIRASACSLMLGETATLQSIGNGADNSFTIAGDVVIRGSLVAQRSNALIVPAGITPLILGQVAPPAATVVDPELSPCNASAATPTPSTAATATPTATPSPVDLCTGDCNGDGQVGIAELVRLTNIALGRDLPCDTLRDGETVGIPLLIRAVRSSLDGCP